MPDIGKRKADHLHLCAEGDVGFRAGSTLFECLKFVHNALPEVAVDEVDLTITLLGKPLKAPLLIAAMTGGTDEALRINRDLAGLAEEFQIGFGLGSQRAMQRDPNAAQSYRIREVAPTTLVLGNLGAVQAAKEPSDAVAALARDVGADAFCIHLNPAMELIQADGDRDFRGVLAAIERLVRDLGMPVVIKETGSGLAPQVARRLLAAGVRHVDVSGAGGTSWVAVETHRARQDQDQDGAALGAALWDWGIPTAASVATLSPLGFHSLIATGGIAAGTDVAKALALGANAAGIARPVLQALRRGGVPEARTFLRRVLRELRAVMVLVGAPNVAALRETPRLIQGELRTWMTANL